MYISQGRPRDRRRRGRARLPGRPGSLGPRGLCYSSSIRYYISMSNINVLYYCVFNINIVCAIIVVDFLGSTGRFRFEA